MTNDKLPEEMQERIKSDAQSRFPCAISNSPLIIGYIAGATAWAPWKVKYNELYLQLKAQDANVEILLSQKKDLQTQAHRMADALEMIANAPVPANDREMLSWFVTAKNIAQGALSELEADKYIQQFKDETKEAEPVKEIEYMPIHPEDAKKFDCPEQFPMHLLNEGQAMSNHGQTLKRLKERGGLSVREILAIVGKKNWSYYGSLPWKDAIKMLNDILTNPTK